MQLTPALAALRTGGRQPTAWQSDTEAVNRQAAEDAKLPEPDWELDQVRQGIRRVIRTC